jgi:hypothetical protein
MDVHPLLKPVHLRLGAGSGLDTAEGLHLGLCRPAADVPDHPTYPLRHTFVILIIIQQKWVRLIQ